MRISDWSSDVCSSDLHEEHAENIRLKRPAELLFRNILNVLVGMLFPGIVDQDVKSAKFTNRLLHRGLAKSGLAHVTCAGYGLRSEEHTSELQSLMRTSYAVFCLKTKHHSRSLQHQH